jgi:tRNA nucleotidyltransferase (CCA-adding enzyme)
MKSSQVLKKVLEEIKPTEKEKKETDDKIKEFLKKLNTGLKNAKAVLYGSGAKGTWLKGGFDADVFVKYDYKKYSDKSETLSDLLEKQLKKKFKNFERLHGSRDYFRIEQEKFMFEIIPILDIKKSVQAKNITDISPLHASWVKSKVNNKLVDEIRLVKKFCKAQKVYGAESYIRGFSGYVTEILTINYGGFDKLLRAATKWKEKQVVDIKKYHKNALMDLNKSKTVSPLIVVDPVDKERNAAASLTLEKFEYFKKVCADYIKKPSVEFFEEKEITEEDIKKKAGKNKLVLAYATPVNGKDDVVGAKLLKAYEYMAEKLSDYEFKIYNKGWTWDKEKKAIYWFVVDNKDLDVYEKRIGPSLEMKMHVEKFKQKHGKTFEEKGRICANVKREYVKAEEFLKELVKEEWFKNNTKQIIVK